MQWSAVEAEQVRMVAVDLCTMVHIWRTRKRMSTISRTCSYLNCNTMHVCLSQAHPLALDKILCLQTAMEMVRIESSRAGSFRNERFIAIMLHTLCSYSASPSLLETLAEVYASGFADLCYFTRKNVDTIVNAASLAVQESKVGVVSARAGWRVGHRKW